MCVNLGTGGILILTNMAKMAIWPLGHVRPIVASGLSLKKKNYKNVAQQW